MSTPPGCRSASDMATVAVSRQVRRGRGERHGEWGLRRILMMSGRDAGAGTAGAPGRKREEGSAGESKRGAAGRAGERGGSGVGSSGGGGSWGEGANGRGGGVLVRGAVAV